MADIAGRTDGPIRGSAKESSKWSKLLEQSEQSTPTVAQPARATVQPTTQSTPTVSASPLVRAAAAYEEAKSAHRIAVLSLEKAQAEEQETRAEEERTHAELLDAVAQIAPKEETS
jgi:hypothetical protein